MGARTMGLHNSDTLDVQYNSGQVLNDRLDVPFGCEKQKRLTYLNLSRNLLAATAFENDERINRHY
jgi:hypothetical protein